MVIYPTLKNLSLLALYNETIVNVYLYHHIDNLSHLIDDLSYLVDNLSHLALQILSNVYFVSLLDLSQLTLQIVMHLQTIVNAELIYPTL